MISSSKLTAESESEASEALERSDGSGSEGSSKLRYRGAQLNIALLAIAEHSDTRRWPQLRLPPPYGLIHSTFPGS